MKHYKHCVVASAAVLALCACGGKKSEHMKNLKAPEAAKIEHRLTNHGDTLVDNYYWLRDNENPETIKHLEAENAYCNAVTAHTEKLRDELFAEMKARIKEVDESVPVRRGRHLYYSRTAAGKQYREYYRRAAETDEAEPELILDCNRLADGSAYFALGEYLPSPDGRMLCYSTDTEGGENYVMRFKNMETGGTEDDCLENAVSAAWAMDNRTVFYTVRDEAWRPFMVMKHVLGTPQSDDREVYRETDERFTVNVSLSKNKKYLMIDCRSLVTSECRLLDASQPDGCFRVFSPRVQNVEYSVHPCDGKFFVLTNADGAVNFKLTEIPENAADRANRRETMPYNPTVKIEEVDEFRNYLCLTMRDKGLKKLLVIEQATGNSEYIEFPDPAYTLDGRSNPNFDDCKMQYVYSSMVRPATTYEFDMRTKTQTVLKEDAPAVPYSSDDYVTERIFAPASDGTMIPLSVVYRKDFVKDGSRPVLLYGYGSYGYAMDATFSLNRISLLDRGFAFAVAHVRGGSDIDRQWYLDGKLMKKKNTFTDFIACAEKLIADKYASPEHLGMMGGSAGGLLVGAVLNMRPDLFGAAVAQVPFVDVMNTICDPTLPLTVGEYEEWGNPVDDAAAYRYMKSYSPYDNVEPRAYPDILATAGLNDPRVSYWEPAKWTLKLRDNNTSKSTIILNVNMGAGHGGASGRYDYLKEVAMIYAFLIDKL